MSLPPLDIAAIARWNAAQRAARLAYNKQQAEIENEPAHYSDPCSRGHEGDFYINTRSYRECRACRRERRARAA